jgi:rod shape-determining protein MreD
MGLQIGVASALAFHDGSPNFVLLAVVFLCLNLPRKQALLASFFLGLAQDCLSQHPAGLFALSYGLTALVIRSSQQVIHRQHPLSAVAMTLMGGMTTAIVLGLHSLIHPAAESTVHGGVVLSTLHDSPVPLIISAVYTAILAPGVMWLLNRVMQRIVGGSPRRAWG